MRKILNRFLCACLVVSTLVITNTFAAPTITAKVYRNGTYVTLAEGETADGPVLLESSEACVWSVGGNSVTDGATSSLTVSEGFGNLTYMCGGSSITFKMSYGATVLSMANGVKEGDTSVKVFSLYEAYFVIDGVKQNSLLKEFYVTGNGTHTISAITADGKPSKNTLTITIPYKKESTTPTTTTTTKKPVYTTKVTTTSSYKGSTSIALSFRDLAEGAITNSEVVLECDQNAFFVINGEKQPKVAKSWTFTEEGSYTVYATNQTNTVNSVTLHFTIDKTAPVVDLKIEGQTVNPSVFEKPVTITSSELSFFYLNGEKANVHEQSEFVVSENGTYAVEVEDIAGNKTQVNFVIEIPEENVEPSSEPKASVPILYMLGGAAIGGIVVAIVMFILNRAKNKDEDDDEDEE